MITTRFLTEEILIGYSNEEGQEDHDHRIPYRQIAGFARGHTYGYTALILDTKGEGIGVYLLQVPMEDFLSKTKKLDQESFLPICHRDKDSLRIRKEYIASVVRVSDELDDCLREYGLVIGKKSYHSNLLISVWMDGYEIQKLEQCVPGAVTDSVQSHAVSTILRPIIQTSSSQIMGLSVFDESTFEADPIVRGRLSPYYH